MSKLYEEIAKVAYELYEKRGRGDGCHVDDWLEAERIVMARRADSAEAGVKPLKRAKTRSSVPAQKGQETEQAAAKSAQKNPKKRTVAGRAAPKKTV